MKGFVMAKVTATQILKEAAELKEKKSKDYQGGLWSEEDYFPFGKQSYIHMMWTKMLRIRNVAEKDDVNFESLSDSLVDMINYAAMFAAYLENKDMDTDIVAYNNMADRIREDQIKLWDIQKDKT